MRVGDPSTNLALALVRVEALLARALVRVDEVAALRVLVAVLLGRVRARRRELALVVALALLLVRAALHVEELPAAVVVEALEARLVDVLHDGGPVQVGRALRSR